jgi:hypothetical protein
MRHKDTELELAAFRAAQMDRLESQDFVALVFWQPLTAKRLAARIRNQQSISTRQATPKVQLINLCMLFKLDGMYFFRSFVHSKKNMVIMSCLWDADHFTFILNTSTNTLAVPLLAVPLPDLQAMCQKGTTLTHDWADGSVSSVHSSKMAYWIRNERGASSTITYNFLVVRSEFFSTSVNSVSPVCSEIGLLLVLY